MISESHMLRASDPRSFNDPFEFKIAVNFDAADDVARARFKADNPQSSDDEFISWWSNLDKPSDWFANQATRQNLLSNFGVACFTEQCQNHLMWSHYANNHTGFCIGYDEALVIQNPAVVASGRVQYSSESPIHRFFSEPLEELLRKAVFVKSQEWCYECEFRVIFDKQGILSLAADSIKEVILGCRAYPELREYVNNRLELEGIKYWQMQEDYSSYSLSRKLVERNIFTMTSHF